MGPHSADKPQYKCNYIVTVNLRKPRCLRKMILTLLISKQYIYGYKIYDKIMVSLTFQC